MAKEIAWGWYHELFGGHPDRVRLPWDEFAPRYAELGVGPRRRWPSCSPSRGAGPGGPDRLRRPRPPAGRAARDGLDALQPLVRARIAEDLRQHVDPRHTPHLGAFVAMLSVYGETTRLAGAGVLSARSRAVDLPWWQGLFNSVASGPPGFRVRELLALSRAGSPRVPGRRHVGRGGRRPLPRRQRHPGRRPAGDRERAGRRPAARPQRGAQHRSGCWPGCWPPARWPRTCCPTTTAACCATPG